MKKWFAIVALCFPLTVLGGSAVSANGQASIQTSVAVEIRYQDGRLFVDNASPNAFIEVYSFVGNRIFSGRLEGNAVSLNLKSGYYIVRINGRLSKKISVSE